MAGARIVLDLDYAELDRAIDTLLQKMGGEARDDLLRDMGEYLRNAHQARFDAEVSPEGVKWAALSPRYKKRKDRARPGAKTLVYDNFLKNQLRYQVAQGELLFGSDREYAAIHQFGGEIQIPARSQQAYFRQDRRSGEVGNRFVRKGKSNFAQWVTLPAYKITIPARPWLGLSAADREELLRLVGDHLRGGLPASPTPPGPSA